MPQVWTVTPSADDATKGQLTGPLLQAPCALGRAGVVPEADKKEGDGATPAGTYALRRVFYRPDKEAAPVTRLPVMAINPTLGWCDDPESPDYNRLVRLPTGASHEKLWRDDARYDLILVLGHNDAPPVPGKGSAIFVHVVEPGFVPTQGCVAFEASALRSFLRLVAPDDLFRIARL